jgi:hypothetical protein
MNRSTRVRAVGLLAVFALAGCGASSTSGLTTQAGSDATVITPGPSASPEHICDPKPLPYPAPFPSLSFIAEGHAGNEWTIPVGTDEVTVRFTITQRPDTEVARMWFVIAPENAPDPGSEIRTFPLVGEDWTPGEHKATVTWDGRNDDGKPVAPGHYHLYGEATTTTTIDVTCADGSGTGVEKHTGNEGAGLGSFSVSK